MESLKKNLQTLSRAAVAFSGGCDSAVLAWLLVNALGRDRVLALTAVSPSMPLGDKERIAALAE